MGVLCFAHFHFLGRRKENWTQILLWEYKDRETGECLGVIAEEEQRDARNGGRKFPLSLSWSFVLLIKWVFHSPHDNILTQVIIILSLCQFIISYYVEVCMWLSKLIGNIGTATSSSSSICHWLWGLTLRCKIIIILILLQSLRFTDSKHILPHIYQ